MSHTIFQQKNVVARKNYYSDTGQFFEWANSAKESGKYDLKEFESIGMSSEEILLIVKCRYNKWQIQKGELHYYQSGVYDGMVYQFRAPLGVMDIVTKYSLNEED